MRNPNQPRFLLSRLLRPEAALQHLNTPLPVPVDFPEPSDPLRQLAASAVGLWVRLPRGMALLAIALQLLIELPALLSPSVLRLSRAVWVDVR